MQDGIKELNVNEASVTKFYSVCKSCQMELCTADNKQFDSSSLTVDGKCVSWLEKCSDTETDSGSVCSCCDSLTTTSCTTETTESQYTKDDESEQGEPTILDDSVMNIANMEGLDLIKSTFGKIQITGSKNAHVGNITNIYGPVYITENKTIVSQQSVTNQTFINAAPTAIPRKLFIVPRRDWLAEPPREEREYLEKPAKYVVICHTATEEGFTQPANTLLVRKVQSYHIESMEWSDIAYNFLVGCDGNVYEGRGWKAIGAHTFGYNNISLGISFIGCFVNKLPNEIALKQAKTLIKHGVDIGAIDKEYRLVTHCQCRPFESPGRKLYGEIKTWKNWYNLEKFGID